MTATTSPPASPSSAAAPSTTVLLDRYRGVFDAVGADAVQRERERRLPLAEVELLRDSGFTRSTLPPAHGGEGAGYEALFELLTELARRDSNLAQALRSHFSFVDRTLLAPPSPARTARLQLLATGAVHGNATFERSSAASGGAPRRGAHPRRTRPAAGRHEVLQHRHPLRRPRLRSGASAGWVG